MTKLVRLYLINIALGFALAAVFVAILLWFDVAGLRGLVTGTKGGMIAVFMLVFFNGLVFSGVQFAIRIMMMAEDDAPGGGLRDPQSIADPVRVRVGRVPKG